MSGSAKGPAEVKVCLGMLARSDAAKEPLIERVLAIMGPSFDGVEILYDEGEPIADFAAARNRLVRIAEGKGYDWFFQLDSDECMFPEDIAAVRSLMTPSARFIVLPRYEFVMDFDHYDPRGYPDWQGRVFRLGLGYRYRRRVHEGIYRRFSPVSERRLFGGIHSEATPIYHYGRVQETAALVLKFHNYDRLANNLPPIETLPPDVDTSNSRRLWGEITPFERPHPLRGTGPFG